MEINKQYNTRGIMASLLICGFVGILSENALNIALSNLMEVFRISAATAQWLTTGFLLVLGILSPISGLLLQRFSTRQLFICALSSSIIGTGIAAIGLNFEMLMAARVLQAIGIGLLMPLIFNTVLVVYPQEKRGAAMGTVGLVYMFAPALGPTVAGVIIQYLSWHFIFWLSLPFLVIGFLVGLKYVENVTAVTKLRIDLLSVTLSTLGFGGVVFGLSMAGEGSEGWTSPVVLTSIIVGFVALCLFILRQIWMKQPLLNLHVFQYPMYIVGVIMVVACMMIFMSTMIILPMYLQNKNGLGLSTLAAGLMLLPGSAFNGILAPRMGSWYDKYGPKWLVIPGVAIMAVMLWFFTGISNASSLALIVVLHIGLMIGSSMVLMPAQTNGLNQLPPELYPHGTAVISTLQQVAGAIGTAVSVSILSGSINRCLQSSTAPTGPAEMAKAMTFGSHNVFLYAMVIALIGFITALFIRRGKVNQVEVPSTN
ncbi:DHA2 family efflux MFS transporter permease subunit [Ectobacillus ponti]|uniref:DHA2 family efflux MFS transporter permease subunit n=1 Tax=Ectobacillus ponti TaxID=2961894 RepID=A0AA41X6B5_9BACI|nr:DHA2 family efflux MFS transporter permease subunit [Ectobacillus ponti]MCP8969749.1 DHA2 family efflux MFS transporter permease subunit [Ectobacillus ponti]